MYIVMVYLGFIPCEHLGTYHYLWRGVGGTAKRNVFRGKDFADPTIKKSRIWLPNLKYQNINTHSFVTHVLYHFCDTSLIMVCEIFCSLKVSCCLHMYFLWRHHLSPNNRKMIKIVTLIDSHIVLTNECWQYIAFQSPIFLWVRLWKDNKFLLPNPWAFFLFFIYQLAVFYLLTQKFVYPTLFSSVLPPPPINNDRSLMIE
jgi:hypothetical protein